MAKEITYKHIRSLTLDASKSKQREFKYNKAAEAEFNRALKKVARAAGNLVESHVSGTKIENEQALMRQLEAYAKTLGPWAEKQSAKLIAKVSSKNRQAFKRNSQAMGAALQAGLAQNGVDRTARALMDEQVALIKSIPLEAGKRAQKLALEATYSAERSDEIAKELLRTTAVTESRATLIARTETARASASITQARAVSIGVRGYIWRTTMDGAERDSHAKMNGKAVYYAQEPTLSDNTEGHAGTFPNCRCFQDPFLGTDEELDKLVRKSRTY